MNTEGLGTCGQWRILKKAIYYLILIYLSFGARKEASEAIFDFKLIPISSLSTRGIAAVPLVPDHVTVC